MAIHPCTSENVWFSQQKYESDEAAYQSALASDSKGHCNPTSSSSIVSEIAEARQHIHKVLSSSTATATTTGTDAQLHKRIENLEKEQDYLRALVLKLENRIIALEKNSSQTSETPSSKKQEETVQKIEDDDDDDDDDLDLFGDDDDEEELEKLREKQKQEAAAKKKKVVIAKSSVVIDVKPWSDETDLKEMEAAVREIEMDGLVWGKSQLKEIAYGIKKLQIGCIVEDDKVSVDIIEEKIQDIEDYVQSTDIAAFQKI